MEARDPPRPPALQMQMQMQAQSAAPPPGSFGAFYHHHLRGGAGAFPSQQQQPPSPQHQQQSGSRNPLIPSIIHTPAALRHPSPSPNPNPNPHPTPNFGSNPNPNPNSSPNPNPSVSACYPPKTPPHMIQHQLHAASSPPSAMGTGTGMSTATAMALSRSDPVKRKRGRPRKYVTDANGPPLASSPLPLSSASPREKKGGRGSGKKAHLSSLGATGQGFTPHVLTIGAGEDVTAKIMTFSQHGPWAVCILSANGAISNASLWHAGISSGPVTYEGRFEVLSLSGLFLLTESSGMRSRTGGLSVSLAGQDGRVIGGRVAGPLMAATPVQVVVGTFFPESRKSHARAGNMEGTSHMPPVGGGARQLSMPADIEQTHMEASGAMQDHIPGPSAGVDNEEHHVSHVMPLQSADWGGSHFDMEARNHSEQI